MVQVTINLQTRFEHVKNDTSTPSLFSHVQTQFLPREKGNRVHLSSATIDSVHIVSYSTTEYDRSIDRFAVAVDWPTVIPTHQTMKEIPCTLMGWR